MNKFILINAMLAWLMVSSVASAATVTFTPKPDTGSGSTGTTGTTGSTGTGTGTTTVTVFVLADDTSETVIKNDKTSVSGVVNGVSSQDPGSFSLVSSPVSNYGLLEFNSNGNFTYQLNNASAIVQALSETDVITDVFTFQKVASNDGRVSQATLTITILSTTPPKQEAEFVVTVIKNEKQEITGNLADGVGVTASFVKLVNGPVGLYGRLDFSSDGSFIYKLIDELPQVQALGLNDAAQEVFNYQVVDTEGGTTNAKLTINILGNPSVSFDNTEIEFNNISTQATPLNSGQYIRGQLTTSGDKDWFVISSLGNEIIHLELCPLGSQCFDEKAWVLYVFDADKVTEQAIDEQTVPLTLYRDDTLEVLGTANADHMYLLHNSGVFSDSLIGVIDPCYGDRYAVDVGVGSAPKNYLVAISTPLLRDGGSNDCANGNVVLEKPGPSFDEEVPKPTADNPAATETKTITTTQEYIVAFPYSDDQYTIKATRTGVNPLAVMTPDSATFDAAGRLVAVPKIRVLDQVYSAQLQQSPEVKSIDVPASFGIVSLEPLNEPLSSDSNQSVYDPSTGVVKMPQVVDLQSGRAFSVDLQYQSEDNTLDLLKVTPVQ